MEIQKKVQRGAKNLVKLKTKKKNKQTNEKQFKQIICINMKLYGMEEHQKQPVNVTKLSK